MGFVTSKSNELLEAGLNARALRQDLVSSNIANIDTPFYKARDIDFETALIEKKKRFMVKTVLQTNLRWRKQIAHI